jgi:uncharacterized membrane protein (UPF0127 family)
MKPTRIPLSTAAALAVSVAAASAQPSHQPRFAQIEFPDRARVRAEVAITEAEHERGLMFRTSLGELDGMLFVFAQPGLHEFWMKNTLIPLDMLWLDSSGKVVSLAESVPPCKTEECPTYPPRAAASFVLEVNGGFARKHKVRVGDRLAISGLDLTKPLPQE